MHSPPVHFEIYTKFNDTFSYDEFPNQIHLLTYIYIK